MLGLRLVFVCVPTPIYRPTPGPTAVAQGGAGGPPILPLYIYIFVYIYIYIYHIFPQTNLSPGVPTVLLRGLECAVAQSTAAGERFCL